MNLSDTRVYAHLPSLSTSHYLAIWIWVGWGAFYFFLVVMLPLLAYFYSGMISLIIICAINFSLFFNVDPSNQPKWAFDFGDWIVRHGKEYCNISVAFINESAISTSGQAIFALEPHGVLPLGIIGFHPAVDAIPNHQCAGCVSSTCFYIPLLRHVYTWVKATSVDRKNLQEKISQGKSPVLCPGGVHEVALIDKPNEVVLFLCKRYGFVKLALQNGIPLVPVYCFGQHLLFTCYNIHNNIITRFGRKMGVMPIFFTGVGGVPFGPPKPYPITVLVGEPITVPLIPSPTADDIYKYLDIFIEKMKVLFEENKSKYGMAHVTLRVV